MQLSFLWFSIMMKWHKLGIERAELSQIQLHRNDSLIPQQKYHHHHHQISFSHRKHPLNPFFSLFFYFVTGMQTWSRILFRIYMEKKTQNGWPIHMDKFNG